MDLFIYVLSLGFILIAIITHELGHAYMSYFLGDPTPKETGRLSPNPLKHIDIMGLIFMFLFRVGWAKPVMINSEYYKNRRLGIFLVALAGPMVNILWFLSTIIVMILINRYMPYNNLKILLINLGVTFSSINLGLALFNLIPIPPLDGSRIFGSFLSANAYIGYMRIERYGMYIIIGLMLLDRIFNNPTLFTRLLEFIYFGIYDLFQMIIYMIF